MASSVSSRTVRLGESLLDDVACLPGQDPLHDPDDGLAEGDVSRPLDDREQQQEERQHREKGVVVDRPGHEREFLPSDLVDDPQQLPDPRARRSCMERIGH